MERIRYLINLLIVFLLLLTVAINRDGRVMGTGIDELINPKPAQQEEVIDYISEDGVRIIESKGIVPGILGYAGPIYLKLQIANDTIANVEVTENTETPSFYRRVVKSGLLQSWDGKSLNEATYITQCDLHSVADMIKHLIARIIISNLPYSDIVTSEKGEKKKKENKKLF